MSRSTSLSLLILSLSGALTTSCAESKCSLSEWKDSTDCYSKDPPKTVIGNLSVSPLRWSLSPGVSTTLTFAAANGSSLEGKTVSIIQGSHTFPVIGNIDKQGAIRIDLSTVTVTDTNTGIFKLSPGPVTLKIDETIIEGGRLYLPLKFPSAALTQEITNDVMSSSVSSVGFINYYDNQPTSTLQSRIALLISKPSLMSLVAYTIPNPLSTTKTQIASALAKPDDQLPNTIAVASSITGFINGALTSSYFQRYDAAMTNLQQGPIEAAGRVSSLATNHSGSLYASIKNQNTEAFIDLNRTTPLKLPNLAMKADRYLVLVGDLDGDQLADVVSWDASGKNPAVLLRNPDKTTSLLSDTKFRIPDVSIDSKSARVPVALADLDRDGLVDLVNATEDGIQIYYNNGDGTFLKEPAAIGPLQNAKLVQALAVAVPAADGSGIRGLVWVESESGKTTTLNVLTY